MYLRWTEEGGAAAIDKLKVRTNPANNQKYSLFPADPHPDLVVSQAVDDLESLASLDDARIALAFEERATVDGRLEQETLLLGLPQF